jgi:hypothetical protein
MFPFHCISLPKVKVNQIKQYPHLQDTEKEGFILLLIWHTLKLLLPIWKALLHDTVWSVTVPQV